MQNTVIREFQDHPDVVTAVYHEGGRLGETGDWMRTFWDNYYLRDKVIWDASGSVGQPNYKQPATGLPFGRGFIIGRDGKVVLPYFGHRPEFVIETIRSLLAFTRGDANADGTVDISDAVSILLYLFSGDPIASLPATDVNDDSATDITDVIFLLDYLFRGGSPPPEPFP